MDRRDLFACKCGCRGNQIDPCVVVTHQALEEECLTTLPVNSGWRCQKHNKAVGGSPTSSHLKGLAADLGCKDSTERYHILRAAMHQGVSRIGIGKEFVHIDMDRGKDQRVIWLY